MEILDVTNDTINVVGTSLVGCVPTTYDKLVETFGEPTYSDQSDDGKVDTEWNLEFRVLTEYCNITDTPTVEYFVATIYNWKTNGTPYGQYDWHVGGNDIRAVELVQEALEYGV